MKRNPALPGLSLLLLCLASAAAQQGPVPVAEEPQHFLVFANDYVRVIDARLPPGYVSLFHLHAEDNVPVAIHGGAIEIERPGAEPVRVESRDGSATFSRGGYTHRVTNRGETFIRYITAEIVASPTSGSAAPIAPAADHSLELENDRVRIYRRELPPGSHQSDHRHTGALLEVVVKGDDPGAFRWLEAGALSPTAAGEALEIVEIEWR